MPRWDNPTLNTDGTKKTCACCGEPLDRVYYDKEDGKEKCKLCYNTPVHK